MPVNMWSVHWILVISGSFFPVRKNALLNYFHSKLLSFDPLILVWTNAWFIFGVIFREHFRREVSWPRRAILSAVECRQMALIAILLISHDRS